MLQKFGASWDTAFSAAELPIAIVLLISIGLLYQIRDNYKALRITLTFTAFGIFLLVFITMMFQLRLISGVYRMIISGIGLFLLYILLNGIIFDRFIAAFRITANVGFIMYIAGAIGYLGSVVVLILKNFGSSRLSWINFYQEVWPGSWYSYPCTFINIVSLFSEIKHHYSK